MPGRPKTGAIAASRTVGRVRWRFRPGLLRGPELAQATSVNRQELLHLCASLHAAAARLRLDGHSEAARHVLEGLAVLQRTQAWTPEEVARMVAIQSRLLRNPPDAGLRP